ncbi:MAG: hypothetical protein HQK50_06495 [Oligoflexia bacterium]|nr:hypothetical protein [Oligoflexia bacterium]MBF0365201.1 hypothetical protein [Oligoflexia bacterium]
MTGSNMDNNKAMETRTLRHDLKNSLQVAKILFVTIENQIKEGVSLDSNQLDDMSKNLSLMNAKWEELKNIIVK